MLMKSKLMVASYCLKMMENLRYIPRPMIRYLELISFQYRVWGEGTTEESQNPGETFIWQLVSPV